MDQDDDSFDQQDIEVDKEPEEKEDYTASRDDSARPQPQVNGSSTETCYLAKVQARRRLFRPIEACVSTHGYQIEPMAAAPHSCQIHAMALSLDANCLLSGGSDGFIRRYDLHATMNGKSMLTQNIRHGFVEGITRGGSLVNWWPNEETPTVKQEATIAKERPVGTVHSLACHKDALWGIAGSESGSINLYGIRHDPGMTRHVFRKHKGAVSALALASYDTEMMSGGWDRGLHQWDLNTAQITRSYPGHAGQISSISFLPILPRPSMSRQTTLFISIRASSPQQEEITQAGSSRPEQKSRYATPARALTRTPPPSPQPKVEPIDGEDAAAVGTATQKQETTKEDDPTEEELAFEAELNASLGFALGEKAKEPSTRVDDADANADGDDEDLFGGETPPSTKTKEEARRGSDGGDSLFGDGDEDAQGDDDDASSDEDMPLAGRPMVMTNSQPGSTIALPGTMTPEPSTLSKNGVSLPSGLSQVDTPTTPSTSTKNLPKPTFGGFSAASGFDADVSTFSSDIVLSSTLAGQVLLWDRRVKSTVSSDGSAQGVRSLPLPEKTPPWCASACFNSTGDRIYVGRRNESVDEWDMRMMPGSVGEGRVNPRFVRSLRLPSGSGPVTALAAMPNSRHIICGSFDNVRLWNTEAVLSDTSRVPFRIVAGHHGGAISHILVDSTCRFLLTASGDRGWMSSSTEALLIHEIKPL